MLADSARICGSANLVAKADGIAEALSTKFINVYASFYEICYRLGIHNVGQVKSEIDVEGRVKLLLNAKVTGLA
jgi:hypothetical protein